MKPRLLVFLMILGSLRAEVQVQTVERVNRFFAPLTEEIVIDGDLAEWPADKSPIVIDTASAYQNPPAVSSAADSSGEVRMAWDGSERLYLAAIVRDQDLVPLKGPDGKPWECDSLMLSLAPYGPSADNPRFHAIKTAETAREPFFGFSWYTDATGPRTWTPNSTYACRPIDGGFTIEASISLPDIGFAPRAGDRIKIAFILPDHDGDGSFTQLIRGMSRDGAKAHWLDLRFLGSAPYAGEIVPTHQMVASGSPVGFSGQIDAMADGLRLTGVTLGDAAGKELVSAAVAAELPGGQTTLFTGSLPGAGLAPGRYQLMAQVALNGQPLPAATFEEVEIILSEEEGAAQAGLLPDRYIVPDPTRFAFPSTRRGYQPRVVTRDDYLALTLQVTDHLSSLYGKGREADAGQHGIYYAVPSYMLFKESGEARYLEATLGLMKKTHETHEKGVVTPHWIFLHEFSRMLLEDPAVPAADKEWLRDFMPRVIQRVWSESRPKEWGAFNRALLWGGMLDIAATLQPEHPDVAQWRTYAELEWNSWWPFRDHDENSSDYNAASMMDYLDWAAFRDPANLEDPELHRWVERYMLQVTPSGAMPGYGDAGPWNESSWQWIALFERMATITRDGRYKWVAHRLFDYATRQIEDLYSYHMVQDRAASMCAWAWYYADDSIAEVPPDYRSQVTTRKKVEKVDEAFRQEMFQEHGITGLFFRLRDEMQPDKLLLRAGGDPFAPAAMIELCSDAGHHASTVPNVNSFMHERAALLMDLGYYEQGPEYHNVIFIEDLTGIAPASGEEAVSVVSLAVGRMATYAAITVENYKRWPVTNDRRVLFTSEGPMLVKDLLHFQQPFVCRVRQQWQTRNISPKAGSNWVNVNIPWMLNSGLGLGRGVNRWLNPNWDLLIYYTPRADRDYEVFDRSLENIWQSVPLRISQRWRGLPAGDRPLHFTSLLWPHKPVFEAETYAERVQVHVDTPFATVISMELDSGETLYLGINDTGERLTAGPITTDAVAFRVSIAKERGGYAWLKDATFGAVNDNALIEQDERGDYDKGF